MKKNTKENNLNITIDKVKKNKKGITLMSLVLYIIAFTIIMGILSSIVLLIVSDKNVLEKNLESLESTQNLIEYAKKVFKKEGEDVQRQIAKNEKREGIILHSTMVKDGRIITKLLKIENGVIKYYQTIPETKIIDVYKLENDETVKIELVNNAFLRQDPSVIILKKDAEVDVVIKKSGRIKTKFRIYTGSH